MRTAMVAALLLGACVPMMEMREGAPAEELRGLVRGFCVAQASGDVMQIAAMFEPKLEAAILKAAKDGKAPAFASSPGAKGCEAGQTWYLGGSRRVMEVRYSGFSDRVDYGCHDRTGCSISATAGAAAVCESGSA
jgi:hypothetical protein